jgi:formamidopyrimidine-DNA glycosylase
VIADVDVLRANMVGDAKRFTAAMKGRTVKRLRRRGKYMLAELDNGTTLILHLKMSGRLAIRKPGDAPLTFERILFHLDGVVIVFNDPRTLGRALVMPTIDALNHPPIKALGPEALEIGFEEFEARLAKRPKRQIKELLMDQAFVAGVGNIYAQEACFIAKVDPRRAARTLKPKERRAVYDGMRTALATGLANMGTSISDFSDLFGKPGQTIDDLWVYGRAGEECRTCGTVIRSTTQGQRTTAWCPACQK